MNQGFFGPGLVQRPGQHESVQELNAYRKKLTPNVRAVIYSDP